MVFRVTLSTRRRTHLKNRKKDSTNLGCKKRLIDHKRTKESFSNTRGFIDLSTSCNLFFGTFKSRMIAVAILAAKKSQKARYLVVSC